MFPWMMGWIIALILAFTGVAAWTAILSIKHARRQDEMASLLAATRQESEDRFRALADAAPLMMWAAGTDKESTFFNKAWLEFSGRKLEDDLGRGWLDNVHPEDRERMLAEYHEGFEARRKFRSEYRMRRRDGQFRWVLDTGGPRLHPDGSFAGFIGTTMDISEQKRALEALQDNEFKYRILVEASLAGVYIVQDQLFKYVNPRLAEIFGYTQEEMTNGLSAWAIVAPENIEHVTEHVRKRWEGEVSTVLYTFRGARKDGRRIELEVLGSITTFRGKPAIIGTMLDITERKNAEKELEQKNALLLQSQKMDAVGRLAGGIAHDFNNLLTSILGYAQFALSGTGANDEVRPSLEEIINAGNRAAHLTQQLLAFARKQDLVVRPTNVNAIMDNLGQMLRRTLGEDVELTIKLDESMGNIEVDPSQIEQAILNLSINSREAMPAGGRLELETQRVSIPASATPVPNMPPGDYALVIVRDNGHGMMDDVKAHLFEPFFSTKTDRPGNGLGLATVYGIVQQCKGYIKFISEPAYGTEFRLYFPLLRHALPKAHAPADHLPRGSETILLVEDEDTVRKLTGKILNSLGYRILEARNGVEAIQMYDHATEPIHLVLTDVVMPQMGGPEMITKILEKNPDCRAVFMSGFADGRVNGNGNGNGQASIPFINKPFTRETLAAQIRETLDDRPVAHHHGSV